MQETSDLYKQIFADKHKTQTKLEVYDKDGTELVHTFASDDDSLKSIKIAKSLFSGATPSAGGTVSNEIDCELYYPKPTLQIDEDITYDFAYPSTTQWNIRIYNDYEVVDDAIQGKGVLFDGIITAAIANEHIGKYFSQFDGILDGVIVATTGAACSYHEIEGFSQITIPRMAMLKPYVRLSADTTIYSWDAYKIIGVAGQETMTYQYDGWASADYVFETAIWSESLMYDYRMPIEQAIPGDPFYEIDISYNNVDALNEIIATHQNVYFSLGEITDRGVVVPVRFIGEESLVGGSYSVSVEYKLVSAVTRGSFVRSLISTNRNRYPDDNPRGLWYVYTGETRETEYSEWLPKGTYWIDTRSTDYSSNKMTIHGYDAMLKGEVMFANETAVEWWPRPDIAVLNGATHNGVFYNGIAQKLGVTIQADSLDLIDQDYEIQFPGTVQGDDENVQGAAYTVRECLSYICAMYGLNATIDEMVDENTGLPVMRFVPLNDRTTDITLDTNVKSFGKIPAFDPFGQVEVIVNENESIFYPTTKDEGTRTLTVTSPWGIQDLTDKTLVAKNIYNIVKNYAYQPFDTTNAILDPSAQLGDGVTVCDVDSVICNSEESYSSSLFISNISAPQDEEIDHEYPYESKENREITRSIASTRARLTVLSDSITAEVTRAEGAENTLSSSLSLVAGKVAIVVDGNNAVKAASIVAAINDSGSEVVIDADHIEVGGIQIDGSQITAGGLNANYITTGTLDASSVSISNLTADFITVDSLNANRINANSWGGLNIGATSGLLDHVYADYITSNTNRLVSINVVASQASTGIAATINANGISAGGDSIGWYELVHGGSAVWG